MFFLLCGFFGISCVNDPEKIQAITEREKVPDETAENVIMYYSEKGRVSVKITTPLMKRFSDKNPYTEMPEGVDVIFFDSIMNIDSRITANYAIHRERDRIMELRNDVVVTNSRNETFNSERLVWEEFSERVYSDLEVKITTDEEILFGEGFESDQYFDKWIIRKPTGIISIEQEEDEE